MAVDVQVGLVVTKQGVEAVPALANSLDKLSASATTAAGTLSGVGAALSASVTAPIVAAFGAAAAAAISYESAFAGVRKTVNASEPELAALSAQFRAMAQEIPVSAVALAGIGEAAGQLGIKTENIEKFTRVVADLSAATNLTAEQGATDLARLANITKMPQESFDRLGSTIVALGNNFATTEREIVSMSLRLASAGATVGLSNAQILGISAALSSVGIEAEAGGTAISKVMIDMAAAVSSGGSQLGKFASVAGMSAAQFSAAWKTDAGAALTSFIKGLGDMQASGGDVLAVLEKLGITEVRMRNALLASANAGDLFSRSLSLAGKAWSENTALAREAEQRYATTASQLEILKNKVTDIAITFGNALLPAIRSASDFATAALPALRAVADGFASLPGGAQLAAIGLSGLAAAAGPVLFVLAQIVSAAVKAREALIALRAIQLASAASAAGSAAGAGAAAGGVAVGSAAGGLLASAGAAASSISAAATSTAALGAAAVVATGALSAGLGRALLETGDASRRTSDDISKGIEQVSLLGGAATLAGDLFGWLGRTSWDVGAAIVNGLGSALKQLGDAFLVTGPLSETMRVAWQNLGESASWVGEQFFHLGQAMYGTGISQQQAATDAKILGDASRIAGHDVRDLAEAVRLVANASKGMPPELARSAEATRVWNVAMAESNKLLAAMKAAMAGSTTAATPAPTSLSDKQIREILAAQQAAADLDKATKALGQTVGDAATAQRVLAISAEMGAKGHKVAAAAVREHDQALTALGMESGKSAQDLREIESVLVGLGGAAKLSDAEIRAAGDGLIKAAQSGGVLATETQAALDRFVDMRIAAETAKQTAAAMGELTKRAAETKAAYQGLTVETLAWERSGATAGAGLGASMQLVTRTLTGAAAVLPRLAQILAGVGSAGGFDALGPEELAKVTQELEKLGLTALVTKSNIAAVTAALAAARSAATTDAGSRDASTARALRMEGQRLTLAMAETLELIRQKDAYDAMASKAFSLNRILQAGVTVLGFMGEEWAGIGAAIDQAAQGSEQFLNAQDLSGVIAGIGGIIQGFKKATDSASGFKRALGGALVGAKVGGDIGEAIGGPIGKGIGAAIGAVGGALIGLFHKPGWVRAGEEAGRVLGFGVSKELAKAIEKTSKDLKIDFKSATLLNLDKAIAESGGPITAFGAQVTDLFGLLGKGGPIAAKAVEQIGFAFTEARKAAEAGDQAARKMMVAMIQQARAAGAAIPEIADAVKAGLDKAFTGLDALIKGVPILSSADVDAQAVLLMSVFWAKVKEEGIVSAALAFGDIFEVWNEKLDEAGVEMSAAAAAMLVPFNTLARLAADEGVRPLLEGIQGARDVLNGLTDAGYATVGMFGALGQEAQTSYDALIAQGVDSQTALLAVAPLLADLKKAADLYGVTLDENSRALIAQAEAAGVAFPTDPLLQVVDLLKQLVALNGGTVPDSARVGGSALAAMGDTGAAAFDKLDARASVTADALGASVASGTAVAQAAVVDFASVATAAYDTLGSAVEQSAAQAGNAWLQTQYAIGFGLDALDGRKITIGVGFTQEGDFPTPPGTTAPPPLPSASGASAASAQPSRSVVATEQRTVGGTTYSYHVTVNVQATGVDDLERRIREIMRKGGSFDQALRQRARDEARRA